MISRDPKADRDTLMRGHKLQAPEDSELQRRVFRAQFVEGKDMDIAKSVDAFFRAVRFRWPDAWDASETGAVLNRTSGFRALMRLLRNYFRTHYTRFDVVQYDAARRFLELSALPDDRFVIKNYEPGSSGEAKLYRDLAESCGLEP
jgi:hypothetical protein